MNYQTLTNTLLLLQITFKGIQLKVNYRVTFLKVIFKITHKVKVMRNFIDPDVTVMASRHGEESWTWGKSWT